MDKKLIQSYYDKCQKYYSLFWTDSESLGVHHGLWYENTSTKKQALMNHYIEIAEFFDIKPDHKVLDAGCGIGGALFWMNKNITKAEYTGINISTKQIEIANKRIQKQNLSNIRIINNDFFNTEFPDNYFNRIFGIESFCYASPEHEKAFLEMNRILQKNGKFIFFDIFMNDKVNQIESNASLQSFLKGWKINNVHSSNAIEKMLKKAGFNNIEFIDKTKYFTKNASLINLTGQFAYPVMKLLKMLNIVSDIELEYAQGAVNYKKMIDLGFIKYGVFYCKK